MSASRKARLLGPPYRALVRLASLDVALVLTADVSEARKVRLDRTPLEGVELELLDVDAMRRLAGSGRAGFADAVPKGLDGRGDRRGDGRADGTSDGTARLDAWCGTAVHEGRLVGRVWYGLGVVPPSLNRGGASHRGAGLSLPDRTCFLFDTFVDPAWRGRSLLHAMFLEGISRLPGGPFAAAVTTTDWTNEAARRAHEKIGFAVTDWTAEARLGPFRPSRLPAPFDVAGGGSVRFFD